MVDCSPDTWEVVGFIPSQVIHKTLKWQLVLPFVVDSIGSLDKENIVSLPIVNCKTLSDGQTGQVPAIWHSSVAALCLLQVGTVMRRLK